MLSNNGFSNFFNRETKLSLTYFLPNTSPIDFSASFNPSNANRARSTEICNVSISSACLAFPAASNASPKGILTVSHTESETFPDEITNLYLPGSTFLPEGIPSSGLGV